jgi:hypothetical protein
MRMNLCVGISKLSKQSIAHLNALFLHPVLLVVLVAMVVDVVDLGTLMLKTGLGPATTVVIGMVIKIIVRNKMDTVHLLDMNIVMVIVHSNLAIKVVAGAGVDTLGIVERRPTWPLMMTMMIMTLHMHLCWT